MEIPNQQTLFSFSSLYIGILAATFVFPVMLNILPSKFQFPLHRDPRCNELEPYDEEVESLFQFPLHRDPRCNWDEDDDDDF